MEIYAARPDVAAIVHTHSVHATAWSFLDEPLDTGTEELGAAAGGTVRTAAYAPTGTDEIAAAAASALGDRGAMLLGRHGVVGVGATPAAALARCVVVERQAQLAWLLRSARTRRGARWRDRRAVVMDADALLARSQRPLLLGIGGGGDVVGALATAEACRAYGADPVVGGVTWERRPIDPDPGPRAEAEIEGARRLAPGVMAATGGTRVRESGVVFAESRMAELLGEETVLVDATLGPAALAGGIGGAAGELGADLIVFVDVGGDALAHGDEPGLASPLCDALLLASAARLAESGAPPVLGAVFGIGCDGELTPPEVLERIAEVAAAGGLAGARGLTPRVAARLEAAVEVVPTEASAQALRCFRGEIGATAIRRGRRRVELSPAGALTFYFDPPAALRSAARLAAAVVDARDLEHANEILHERGVYTELDYERDALHTKG
jgi:hypothetical protein